MDLRFGAAKEIYPIKDDPLRAEFARLHEQQMPPPTSCQEADDPCDPDLFDESIQFLDADQSGRLKFRVLRNASHPLLQDRQTATVASQSAVYVYERRDSGWRYCEFKIPADAHQTGTCKPSSLVVADQDTGLASPFPAIVRKEK